jgi:hypothetical protein
MGIEQGFSAFSILGVTVILSCQVAGSEVTNKDGSIKYSDSINTTKLGLLL